MITFAPPIQFNASFYVNNNMLCQNKRLNVQISVTVATTKRWISSDCTWASVWCVNNICVLCIFCVYMYMYSESAVLMGHIPVAAAPSILYGFVNIMWACIWFRCLLACDACLCVHVVCLSCLHESIYCMHG